MSDMVNANVLFIAAMYINFIGSLSKSLYFKYVIKVFKAAFYVLGFYYLGATTGIIFFFMYMINMLFQALKLSKFTLAKIFFTVIAALAFIYFKEFHIIDILMYLLFISFFWIRAFIKKERSLIRYRLFKKTLIATYAYTVGAYTLAVFEIMSVAFYFVSGLIKSLTDFTNKRT